VPATDSPALPAHTYTISLNGCLAGWIRNKYPAGEVRLESNRFPVGRFKISLNGYLAGEIRNIYPLSSR